MLQRLLLITLTLCSLTASAQWQQTGSKVRYVNGLGIPTKDTAAGVAADSSQILIRPADSSLYIKYKRTWVKVGAGGGGTIGGSGTTNYVPKFTAGTTLGNSQIFDDGTEVGIGTTTLGQKLTVAGNISTGNALIENVSTNVNFGTITAGFLAFLSGSGGERMRITAGGNVLINTTTDNGVDKLQVSGSASFSTNIKVGTYVISSYNNEILAGADAAGYYYANGASATSNIPVYIGDRASFIAFKTSPSTAAGIERMRILSSGRTLMGVTLPTDNGVDALQVSGSMNVSAKATAQTLSVTSNTTVGGTLNVTGSTLASSFEGSALGIRTVISFNASPAAGITGTISNHDYYLQSNATTRAVITATGRILANTTTDNGVDELQVNGSISGIGFKQAYVTKTGAYTATNDDYVIDCTSGTFTVTLPASSGRTGRILIIKNSGAGTITVDGNGAETIDGAATYSLAVQYATVQIMSDGTNWKIISKF